MEGMLWTAFKDLQALQSFFTFFLFSNVIEALTYPFPLPLSESLLCPKFPEQQAKDYLGLPIWGPSTIGILPLPRSARDKPDGCQRYEESRPWVLLSWRAVSMCRCSRQAAEHLVTLSSCFAHDGTILIDKSSPHHHAAGKDHEAEQGLDASPRSAPSKRDKLCTYHCWFAHIGPLLEPYF